MQHMHRHDEYSFQEGHKPADFVQAFKSQSHRRSLQSTTLYACMYKSCH